MAENITVDPKDAEDNKIMAILAYLNILVLVPIFAAKESPFARFHANQGLVLLIASIALYFVFFILAMVLIFIIPALVSMIYWILYLGIGVFVVLGIINAVKGEAKELPLIGKIKILK